MGTGRMRAAARRLCIWALPWIVAAASGCAWLAAEKDRSENWSAQRFHAAGKQALADGDYEQAIKYFEQLEARYPYGPYAAQAQLEVAYAYYKFGERESAVAAAERFIQMHPAHPAVDYAYYLKGLALFDVKRGFLDRLAGEPDLSDRDPKPARRAFAAFRELLTRFPKSKYAPDARQRMAYLLNALARHDVRVARFYLDRGAYVAAVNRCKYVIEHYQGAPALEDALALMAIAYRKMGMEGLAADAVRVLEKNFPRSRYLSELKARAGAETG